MKKQQRFRRHRSFLKPLGAQGGFSLVDMVITVTVISIATTLATMGISRARTKIALQNSVRRLADNIEKARLDAVRRHSDPINSPTTASKVVFTSYNTYTLTIDFDGTGTPYTRTFTFDSGVPGIPTGSPLPAITFNWRGRTSSCTTTFAIFNSNGEQSTVDVSDAGEVTIDSDVDVLPAVSYNTTNPTIDVASGTVVSGTGTHNNTVDCSDTDTGVQGPPESGGGSGSCPTWTVNPSSLSIKKNGGSTGTIQLTVGSSATVTASAPSNMQVTPASIAVSGSGTANFSVTSLNKTRGTFAVTLTLPCSSPQVMVKVTN
jgi:Tfp pilus assembly protein FimT